MKGAEGKAKQEESLLPIKLSDLLCMKIHNCNSHMKRIFLVDFEYNHEWSFGCKIQILEYREKSNLPSRLIPAAIHFFKRQYWHRLRLILRILHCWFFVQGRYWIFCWIDLRKKPWKYKVKQWIKGCVSYKMEHRKAARLGCSVFR